MATEAQMEMWFGRGIKQRQRTLVLRASILGGIVVLALLVLGYLSL